MFKQIDGDELFNPKVPLLVLFSACSDELKHKLKGFTVMNKDEYEYESTG